jgi:O-Antigen ligase
MRDTIARPVAADIRRRENRDLLTICALFTASVLAVILSFADVRFAFVPILAVIALGVLRAFEAGMCFPKTGIGWLYAVIIFATCSAPALGAAGLLVRVALASLAAIAFLHNLPREHRGRFPRFVTFGLALLVVSLVGSALTAPSYGFGVARLVNWTMFIPLIFLAYYRPDVRGVAFGIVASSVFQMLGVGLQFTGILGGSWGGLIISGSSYNPDTSVWLTRYTGFVLNPNNLALILVLGVVTLATALFAEIPARLKFLCLCLIGLFVFGIVLSGSRGGIVALVLGLLVVFTAVGARGLAFGTFAGVAVAITVQMSSWDGLSRVLGSFVQIIGGTDTSANQRNALWIERLGSVDTSSLLLGGGFGGYDPSLFAHQSGFNIDPGLARQATIDNGWIKLLLESGLVGVSGLAIVLLVAIWTGLFKARSGQRLVGLGAGAALAAMTWRSISVDMLDQNPWNAILFLTAGIALASQAPRVAVVEPPAVRMLSHR